MARTLNGGFSRSLAMVAIVSVLNHPELMIGNTLVDETRMWLSQGKNVGGQRSAQRLGQFIGRRLLKEHPSTSRLHAESTRKWTH